MEEIEIIGKKALKELKKSGFCAFFVGGAVRDRIMKRKIHDIDIATDATTEEVTKIFCEKSVIPTGLKHGTVTVVFEKTPIEITTFRTEEDYFDNRHPNKVSFSKNILDDLSRRDFTMNAIAESEDGILTDPFGGRGDIEKKLIKAVGEPEIRFNEDSLRILRALRFSAVLGFSIEERTDKAIRKCRALLKNLSPERVSGELSRLLCGKNAPNVLFSYPEVLGEVIPVLLTMNGFFQHNRHHCFDVFEHTVNVLKNVRPELYMRLAALFHDCAKPQTFSVDENGEGHFYSHAPKSAAIAKNELERLRFDGETIERAVKLIKIHDSPIECDEVTVKKKLRRLGERTFFDLVELQRADNLSQSKEFRFRQNNFDYLEKTAKAILKENECFSLRSLAVNGNDMLSLGFFGKEVGAVLDFLVEKVIEKTAKNEREELINLAEKEKNRIKEDNK